MKPTELLIGFLFFYSFFYLINLYLRTRLPNDEEESGEEGPETLQSSTPSTQMSHRVGRDSQSATESILVCPTCGSENDAEYTYCKGCLAELDAMPTPF